MSRARFTVAVVFLSAAALIAIPGAFAASPQEIYKDYADNGRLDAHYSSGDIERALNNAVVQGYTPTSQGGVPYVPPKTGSSGGGTSGGGTSGGGSSGGSSGGGTSPSTEGSTSGGLPFTGLDLTLIVFGAFGLILLGAGMRRFARQKA